MKKIRFSGVTNHLTVFCLVGLGLGIACARPTYWVAIRELSSSCDGDVNVRLWHDADPDEAVLKVADDSQKGEGAKKIAFLKDESPYLKVVFNSGVVCRFFANEPEGDCREAAHSNNPAQCKAQLKLARFLPPTHDGGFDGNQPPAVPSE